MRSGRTSSAVAAAVALAGSLLVPAARGAASCRGIDVSGSWATIRTPTEVRAFAAGPGGRGRLLVTDGETVFASDDGGCAWRSLFRLPATPSAEFPFATERITTIAAPSKRDIYLALTGPHVVVSRDAGRTWATADEGLAGRADRSELTVAPSDPRSVYLIARTTLTDEPLNNGITTSSGTTATVTTVFRSRDGARTWERAGGVPPSSLQGPRGQGISKGVGPGSIWEVAVDPDDPSRLWAAGTEGIFASSDGGETWTGEVTRSQVVGGADVRAIDAPASPAVVVAIDPAAGTVYSATSAGGASRWSARSFPGFRTASSMYAASEPVSLGHSSNGMLVGASPKGVFRLGVSGWSDISPVALGTGSDALTDITADPSAPGTFYARPANLGTTLFRYAEIDEARTDGPRVGDGDGSGGALAQLSQEIGALARPRPALLAPRRIELRVPPGESVTRTLRLSLPPHPTPVDLYFLLDTTTSMSGVVRSLARSAASIVTDLRARGIDVWAGLGQFRTYPYPGEEAYNFPYRREVPVSPPGRRLARALLAIEGTGQSGSNLTALLHSASGVPLDLLPPGPSEADIEAGSDAAFRDRSLRVVVHAADSEFGTVERGDPDGNKFPPGAWPGPGFEEVTAALNAAGVRQVGGAVGFEPGFRPETGPNALEDLERVARATGALAPAGGIDCDDDRRADIRAGAPLVCPLPGGRGELLRPAIVSLVNGLRDVAKVRLVEAGSSGVVGAITPGEYPAVDVKSFQRLAFAVTFSCAPRDAGRTFEVELQAELRDEPVAGASARVACGRSDSAAVIPGAASSDPRIAVPIPPPHLPLPPPPPANAAPAQAPAPQPQTQPNPNPNPQAQPHPVVVAQRQAQPQMAFVHAVQQVRQQAAMEYAMSSMQPHPDRSAGIKLVAASGALSLLLLYAYAAATVAALRPARLRRP
jgi:hypothetical protein